ncbi:hypothetical protein JCM8202v2_002138 [Rhodotorula sphaerocarpa]
MHSPPANAGLSYARASSSNLPPTTAPEGVSLPPTQPANNSTTTKERPLWVRPDGHASEKNRGNAAGTRTPPSAAGRTNPGQNGVGRQPKPRRQSNSTHTAASSGASTPPSAEQSGAKRPRTVPGMPASMLPPVANKKAKHKSMSSQSQPASPQSGDVGQEQQQQQQQPAIGKKRRSNLRKTLPPTASKLSALAASFDFVPRGAPSLPSTSSDSAPAAAAEEAEASPSSASPTPADTSSSEQDQATPAPAEESQDTQPTSGKDDLVLINGQEAAAIRDTVASAGAQGDEFRSHSLSAADAQCAVQASGTDPSLQSASARKPVSAGSAPEPERRANGNGDGDASSSATLPVVETNERSLGGFLPNAFIVATGEFAPLELPQEQEQQGSQTAVDAAIAAEPVPVTQIPGAVDVSPIADLSWREKKGWWSPENGHGDQDAASIEEDESAATPAGGQESVDPAKAGPAAVAPAQSQAEGKEEVLLQFPPWKPAAMTNGDGGHGDDRPAQEVLGNGDAAALGDYLPEAFAASSERGTEAATSAPASDAQTGGAASSALSSFLSGSFSATGPPAPLEAPTTVEVRPEGETAPLNAEAVAAEPPLADVLDVDAEAPASAPVAATGEKKHGWWSPGYVAPDHATGEGLVDSQLVQETVGSAGAQGDEFRAQSYAEADREGAREVQPTEAGQQSAAAEPVQKKEQQVAAGSDAAAAGSSSASTQPAKQQQPAQEPPTSSEPVPERSGTPIGDFLGQAFSSQPAETESPAEIAAPPSSSAAPHETGEGLVDTQLVQETVGSAGAQGDEFRAQSHSDADREGEAQLEPAAASAQSAGATVQEKKEASPSAEEGEQPRDAESGEQDSSATASRPAASSASSATSTPRPSGSTDALPTITASTPVARRRRSSSSSSSSSPSRPSSPTRDPAHPQQPAHSADDAPSLTLAISSAWHTAPWSRKLWAVLASVAINVGLPFINGVMLGFGELFARNVLGVRLGWPLASSGSAAQGQSSQRANTGSVGLRAAGANPGVGREVPGHAGTKTAAEAAAEGVRELAE